MSFSNCPDCGLPRDSAEVTARCCPLCGWDPSKPTTPKEIAPKVQLLSLDPDPLPIVEEKPKRKSLRVPFAIIIVAMIIGVLAAIFWPKSKGGDTANPSVDVSQAPIADEPVKPTPLVQPKKKTDPNGKQGKPPKPVEKEPVGPELAPEPRLVQEILPPIPMPKVGEVVVQGDVETINLPDGEYIIEALKDDTKRVLKGEVKLLRLGGLAGKVCIDASQLKAARIIVNGSVEGEAVLKLYAPHGRVEFRGKVDGKGSVEINAPKGKVNFALATTEGQEGSKIDGNAKVVVTAQHVDLHGKIDGAAHLTINAPDGNVVFVEPTSPGSDGSKIGGSAKVEIFAQLLNCRGRLEGGAELLLTIGNEGLIIFQEMTGGAKFHYRKAAPDDLAPRIERGSITGGAEFKFLK